ncbi:helix-turn-helix domain-containing protein [Eisenbergiella sp.]
MESDLMQLNGKSLEALLKDAPSNLVIRNPDSNILQLYELHTPFMILLETCHEQKDFISMHQITHECCYSSHLSFTGNSSLLKRPLHQHSCFEIMYVLSGSVTNHVENQTFTYGPGQCCIMNKNIKHCEDFSGDFQVVFFMFQDGFLEQLMTEYGEEALTADSLSEVNPIYQLYLDSKNKNRQFDKVYLDYLPVIPAENVLDKLNPLFNFLVTEIQETKPGSFFFLKGTFARFLHLLHTPSLYCMARVQSDSSSQEYIFSKVTHIMEASHGRSTREYLEKQLHYNGEYLNRIVKKYTGKTILEFGQEIYLQKAKRLLLDTDMSISEIIAELGFSNRSHFYRVFQKAFGETPLDYRRRHEM